MALRRDRTGISVGSRKMVRAFPAVCELFLEEQVHNNDPPLHLPSEPGRPVTADHSNRPARSFQAGIELSSGDRGSCSRIDAHQGRSGIGTPVVCGPFETVSETTEPRPADSPPDGDWSMTVFAGSLLSTTCGCGHPPVAGRGWFSTSGSIGRLRRPAPRYPRVGCDRADRRCHIPRIAG